MSRPEDAPPAAPVRSALLCLLSVLAGGMLGTALRLGGDALIPSDAFPFSTLTVNVVGSFVLGLLVVRVWPVAPDWLRACLGAGLLGSFTTFSAIMVSIVHLATDGGWIVAGVYLATTLVLGFAAAATGIRLAAPGAAPPIDEVTE